MTLPLYRRPTEILSAWGIVNPGHQPPHRDEVPLLGSPPYMAPELVRETAYDFKVDVWAIGVITYILMSGFPPFYDKSGGAQTKEGIYRDILNSNPDYSLMQGVSQDAIDFVEMCLKKKPSERATMEELLNSAWI